MTTILLSIFILFFFYIILPFLLNQELIVVIIVIIVIIAVIVSVTVIVASTIMLPSSKNIFNEVFVVIVLVVLKILVVFKEVGNNIVAYGMTTQRTFHVLWAHLDQTGFMEKVLALQGNTETVFLTNTALLRFVLVDHKRLVKNARIAFLVLFYESTAISAKFILLRKIPYVQNGAFDILEFLAPPKVALRIMNIILYPHTHRIVNTPLAVNHSIHKDILIRGDARIL